MTDEEIEIFFRNQRKQSVINSIAKLKEKRNDLKDKNNRYINSLFDSYIKSLEKHLINNDYDPEYYYSDERYFYKYEVYEKLDQINCMLEGEDSAWDHVEQLIERLKNNIDIIGCFDELYKHSLDLEEIHYMKSDLEEIKEYIEYGEFETALEINNRIIKKYFEDKEDKYRKKIKEGFIKRRDKEKKYLELLNSYEYKMKKITKRDIAKILKVTPAAVTQFCKRHGIP